MSEQFCNYEISKKLKELGFNNPCLGYYHDKKLEHFALFGTIEGKSIDFENNSDTNLIILAPLWQQVIDWLREKYNFNIKYEPTINKKYDIFLNKEIGWEFYKSLPYYEAREQIILKALEIIKQV